MNAINIVNIKYEMKQMEPSFADVFENEKKEFTIFTNSS